MRYSAFALLVILVLLTFTFLPNKTIAESVLPQDAIMVGNNPIGVAVNPNTNMVYVANSDSDTISVIDGSTNKIVANITLDSRLTSIHDKLNVHLILKTMLTDIGVNADTNSVYVAKVYSFATSLGGDVSAQQVITIDGSTNMIVSDNLVWGDYNPTRIAVNPNTDMIYVINSRIVHCEPCPECGACVISDFLWAINASTNEKTTTTRPLNTQDVAVNPNTNEVYTAHITDSGTSFIVNKDWTNNFPKAIFETSYDITGIVANPNTNKIYISSAPTELPALSEAPPPVWATFHGSLHVLDGSTYKSLANLTLPYPTSIAVNPNINRVYVTNPFRNEITVIDGSTDEVIDRVKVGKQPQAIAVNPNTNTVYVVNQLSNSVTVIDGATNKIIPEFSVLAMIVFAIAVSLVVATFKKRDEFAEEL